MPRSDWSNLTDEQLLAQCEVDTYRASGPGGQKRNKTSSAVRLRHTPSGLIVIAEESRSQHENKARALQRLRKTLFLELREPIERAAAMTHPAWTGIADREGHIQLGRRDPRVWPALGVALDVLAAVDARVSDAAEALGVSTAQFVDFLQREPKVWQQANILRAKFGQKPLKS